MKAHEIAASINNDTFKASNGWLESFQRRHNLKFKTFSGKSNAMDQHVIVNWKSQLNFLLREFDLKNIFNMDETSLFWCGLPTKSLSDKKEQAKGGKLAKERLTIAFVCSATGENYKPLVIGKAWLPRAFKKTPPSTVFWRSNKKLWMTGALYSECLIGFN